MIQRIFITLTLATAIAAAQSGVPLELPAPPPPPPQPGPFGLLLLGFVLSFVCLPLSLLAFVILLLVLVKVLGLFKITPARLLAGIVASGGVGALKMMLWPLGLLITIPAALLATGWAARILDRRLDAGDRFFFACAIGVLVAVVFLAIVKKLAAIVREKMLGGMMPGMMPGRRPMKQAKPAGRPKRR